MTCFVMYHEQNHTTKPIALLNPQSIIIAVVNRKQHTVLCTSQADDSSDLLEGLHSQGLKLNRSRLGRASAS